MNEFSIAARRPREPAASSFESLPPSDSDAPAAPRLLADLNRDELLREALYEPGAEAPADDDRLRQEVRWRRAAALREPAFAALARLFSKVSPHSFETLSQGDFSPAQLIDEANAFVSGRDGVKVLKIPDRVEDHERRLNNLESSGD